MHRTMWYNYECKDIRGTQAGLDTAREISFLIQSTLS